MSDTCSICGYRGPDVVMPDPYDAKLASPHDAELATLRAENERLRRMGKSDAERAGRLTREARDVEEAEGRCCPEDVGFEEYIGTLTRELKGLNSELNQLKVDHAAAEQRESTLREGVRCLTEDAAGLAVSLPVAAEIYRRFYVLLTPVPTAEQKEPIP